MTKPRSQKQITFPFVFERNGRTGKIYKNSNGTFATAFTFAGTRKPNTHGSFEAAFQYLDGEFTKLDNDRENSLALHPLNGKVRDYSELELLLKEQGGGASLREAVTFYLANFQHKKFTPMAVKDCVTAFLASKANDGIGELQIKALKKDCNRFALTFGEHLIHELSVLELETWLSNCTDEKTGEKWSAKTRTNARGSLVSLFGYAQKKLKAIRDIGDTEMPLGGVCSKS